MTALSDRAFLEHVADLIAALPGVLAVTLGGSRAEGTHTPESDWDYALYYRDGFDPADLRATAGTATSRRSAAGAAAC